MTYLAPDVHASFLQALSREAGIKRRLVEMFILRNPFAQRKERHPGFTSYDIAERVGMSPSRVRQIKQKMVRKGIIPRKEAA